MGIYDRDYERDRDDSPGFHLGGERTWTTNLVILMGIIYVVQLVTQPGGRGADGGWFTETFSLSANLPLKPWMAFQLITYGFLHDIHDLRHIIFNCLGLWMFGRSVEVVYGKKEYLTFFLSAVAFAGVAWLVSEFAANREFDPRFQLLGASGGIAAVLILYCLHFPRNQIYIWGVLPMPAWVFAILFVALDLFGTTDRESNVAYTAHIGGALFAFIYFKSGWRLSQWLPGQFRMPKIGRRPPLRVHNPVDDGDDDSEDAVDNILRKIQEHGQESLTREERRILEEASREYQKRRN
jgi:membrane associated rhomboid family serine protease